MLSTFRKIFSFLIPVLLLTLLAWGGTGCRATSDQETSPPAETTPSAPSSQTPLPDAAEPARIRPGAPAKVYEVLAYIRKHDRAPEGYIGGRRFGNYEKHLPQTTDGGRRIEYREWDVNPKRKGKNRGAERLVTGSDGRAWYTRDHYNSFTEVLADDAFGNN